MPRLTRHEYLITVRGSDVAVANLRSKVAVIVTHPWGPLGGSLSNNVVAAAVVYFQNRGMTTVRLNFAGSQIGRGTAQVEQVKQIANDLLDGSLFASTNSHEDQSSTALPTQLILCGYSYGSLISSSASASIPQVIASISIAPPFGVSHWLLCFNSRHHLQQAAERRDIDRLFIMGTLDNFSSETVFRQTIQETFVLKDRSSVVVMPGVDHFFAGRNAMKCMEVVGEWLTKTLGDTLLQGLPEEDKDTIVSR